MKASTKMRLERDGFHITGKKDIQLDLNGKPVQGQYTFDAFK